MKDAERGTDLIRSSKIFEMELCRDRREGRSRDPRTRTKSLAVGDVELDFRKAAAGQPVRKQYLSTLNTILTARLQQGADAQPAGAMVCNLDYSRHCRAVGEEISAGALWGGFCQPGIGIGQIFSAYCQF